MRRTEHGNDDTPDFLSCLRGSERGIGGGLQPAAGTAHDHGAKNRLTGVL